MPYGERELVIRPGGWFRPRFDVYALVGMTGMDEEWVASFRHKLDAEIWLEREKSRMQLVKFSNRVLASRAERPAPFPKCEYCGKQHDSRVACPEYAGRS